MTEVLTITAPSDGVFGSNTLRRSTSQTSFFHQSPYHRSAPNVRSAAYSHVGYDVRLPASVPSSAATSPRLQPPDFSRVPSFVSTPSSNFSLGDDCEYEDDDILFPSYDDSASYDGLEDSEPPPSPVSSPVEETNEPAKSVVVGNLSLAGHETPQVAGDDTAIKSEPSRHVDYLSHNWREEDIWSSWRYVVVNRKVYGNGWRLENASWRTWAKSRSRLRTIPPETLNWMKEHDTTWLYGPLQVGNNDSLALKSAPAASWLSRTNSFATKKPILKKRSLSELMLRRSISSSTLMRQAIDALQAQQPTQKLRIRPQLDQRLYSDFVRASSSNTPSDIMFAETPSAQASASSSGLQTPSERRHIHFNDKVEQCIAINKEADSNAIHDDSDSSDDGIIMMKAAFGKERKLSNRNAPRGSISNEGKTIAMLPSTTLKYRSDTPEPLQSPPKRTTSLWDAATKLMSSPSQETLKPSKSSSSNFLLDDDDDDADLTWTPSGSASGRCDDMTRDISRMSMTTNDNDYTERENGGLRRTPSGMFMPDEEDEDDIMAASLFGKVIDTVNTAKDIAHVIWNVGWRR